MKVSKNNAVQGAFSLVEMLVVIAVIGIIAAIAVPNIGKINDSAKEAKMRRNAQNIASVYSSAQAAGYDFAYTDGDTSKAVLDDEAAMITAIIAGAKITDEGPFKDAFFGVPSLNTTEATSETAGAAKYLEWDADLGMLKYTGGASGTGAGG